MAGRVISFKHSYPLEQTMGFEAEYPEGLRLSIEEKRELLSGPEYLAVWMEVDDKLVGEIYGVPAIGLDEPGLEQAKWDDFYLHSQTILTPGKGLGSILLAYWLGCVRTEGWIAVVGHARPGASQAVLEKFGAEFGAEFPNWYESNQTYRFFTITL